MEKYWLLKMASLPEIAYFWIWRFSVIRYGALVSILLYNKNQVPDNWNNFDSCFAPNNTRGYDACHDFRLKYPFGTIHLLIPILGATRELLIPTSAITPLLFTDGTWMNLLQYTENSLDWIHFLKADDPQSPLHRIFLNDHYSLHSLMVAMDDFLRERDKISIPKERGDRIAITIRGGEGLPHNLERERKTFYFKEEARERGERFIRLLSELTGWKYDPSKWSWRKWKLYKFTKGDFADSRLNGQSFAALMARNPLSFAITSSQNLEYTIEEPDHLP